MPGSFTNADGHTGKCEVIANAMKIVKIDKRLWQFACYLLHKFSELANFYHPS